MVKDAEEAAVAARGLITHGEVDLAPIVVHDPAPGVRIIDSQHVRDAAAELAPDVTCDAIMKMRIEGRLPTADEWASFATDAAIHAGIVAAGGKTGEQLLDSVIQNAAANLVSSDGQVYEGTADDVYNDLQCSKLGL
jgi:hypothetical protein